MNGNQTIPDATGILIATACAIHCVATPVFVSALAVIGVGGGESPVLEWGFFIAAAVVGGLTLRAGQRRHGQPGPRRFLLMGLLSLAVARALAESQPFVETALVVVGAVSIVGAHLLNLRASHHCSSPSEARPVPCSLHRSDEHGGRD